MKYYCRELIGPAHNHMAHSLQYYASRNEMVKAAVTWRIVSLVKRGTRWSPRMRHVSTFLRESLL